MRKLFSFFVAFLLSATSFAAVSYELNGGVTNDDNWLTKNDMFQACMADCGVTGLATLDELKASADPFTTICGKLTDVTGMLNAEKWDWLEAYIISVQNVDANATALVEGTTSAGWRYAVAAFFLESQRTLWPKSTDFSVAGKVDAFMPAWKQGFANPTEPTAEFVLNAPYKDGYDFAGWYTTANFSGNKVTKIDTFTTGKLYAKWNISIQSDGLYYKIVDDFSHTLELISSSNYITTISIPKNITHNGITYSVTSIGYYAFRDCSSLTSITIPNSVTSIGNSAFANCRSLTSITIPNSVTSIGSSAFYNCSSLTSVTISNSVTSIRSSAFYNCSSLTSITIPNSVTSIAEDAFYGCSSLTSVTLTANSVEEFCQGRGNGLLYNVGVYRERYIQIDGKDVVEITIPNSITSIGDFAFYNCTSLTSVTIGNSVTTIGDEAFKGCEKLGTLVLGDKVNEIGDRAFNGCNKLYHIYCYAPEPPVIAENVFTNYNVNLYIPCNYLDNYKYDIVFGSFRYIQCIDSEDVTTNDVVVTSGTNDVTITWPTEGNADTYTIVIKKGGEVFCTLTFNAEGQLLNIAFAPGRDGNHPAHYAEQAGKGYRFTVTSLESGTKYGYNIDVKDASNKTIKSHSGEFTTQSTTAVDNITTNNANIQKIMRDGQLIIVRDGKTYNAQGAAL